MKRLILLSLAALFCLTGTASASQVSISVTNRGPFSRADMASIERAISTQIRRDVRPHWNVPNVSWGKTGTWTLEIDEDITAQCGKGYAGCHTIGANGQPTIYVLDQFDTYQTVVTISHEVIESLVDPSGYGHEVCDPVYRSSYPIGDWPVSDFVYPRYYRRAGLVSTASRNRVARRDRVDFMGVIR